MPVEHTSIYREVEGKAPLRQSAFQADHVTKLSCIISLIQAFCVELVDVEVIKYKSVRRGEAMAAVLQHGRDLVACTLFVEAS